jgi:hypothetical protein
MRLNFNQNTPITLDHLKRVHDAVELFYPKGLFDDGADMSQDTYNQLISSGKVIVMKQRSVGISTETSSRLGSIDIHIVPGIPLGKVEPCNCKERQRHG